MGPLIFRKLAVPWAELRGLDGLGFAAARLPDPGALSTFPIPGSPEGSALPVADAGGVLFPEPGAYYFRCRFGVFKALVLPDGPDIGSIIAVAAFVSANSVHSHADRWLIAPYRQSQPLNLDPVHTKLFYSDQPVALHCGHVAALLVRVLIETGFRARQVQLWNPAEQRGHIVAEAWSDALGKWVMLDPDFGAMLEGALSVDEIMAADPASLRLIDIGRKPRLQEAFKFSHEFMGFYAWNPSHNAGPMLTAERYLGFVVPERFVEATYADFAAA